MNYLLVVDDSAVDRQLASRFLERRFNYQIEFASTGWEAVEQLESKLPLAVITDLAMPEMDGLQLTAEIRRRFPNVPVILMTAHGSEEIAAEALALGAADYVPKSKLPTELCRAVESVLTVAAGSPSDQRLSHLLQYEQTRYVLKNDVMLIPAVVDHLQRSARDMELVDDGDRIRLAKALVEVLRNAMYHGNLELSPEEISAANISPASRDSILASRNVEPYCSRHVTIESTITPDIGRFVIRDDGPGFDAKTLLGVAADRSQLAKNERRGLVLIRAFMDEVTFNERGNEITLVMHKRRAARAKPSGTEAVAESRPPVAAN